MLALKTKMLATSIIAVNLLACGCGTVRSTVDPLPIMVLDLGEGSPVAETVYLPADYGFFINWPKDGPGEFYLYDRPAHRITYTVEFSGFLAGLKGFPRHATVAWIETCTVIRSLGIPTEQRRRLRGLLEAKRFRMHSPGGHGHFGVCTCQSRDYELLKHTNN